MSDVAIIGVGLHPFGRFGDKSAFEMGADAVELALTDAGLAWSDVQCAFGGAWEVAQTDPLTSLLGLSGIPFTNVFNACATGGQLDRGRPRTRSVRAPSTSPSRWGWTSTPGARSRSIRP